MTANALQIGFELEFCSLLNEAAVLKQLNALGIHAAFDERHRNRDRANTNWHLTYDGSLRWQNGDPQATGRVHGHELISPVFPLETGLKVIDILLKWVEDGGHWTNTSTGFHVGISFIKTAENKKINRLKLIALLEEDKYLRKFKRSTNRYCRSHKKTLAKQFSDTLNHTYSYQALPADPAKLLEVGNLQASISTGKYFSVNFGKLAHNYLEFRIIGGKNYHKRLADVKEAILHFAQCVKTSTSTRLTDSEKKVLQGMQVQGLKTYQKTVKKNIKKRQDEQRALELQAENAKKQTDRMVELSTKLDQILNTGNIQYT